VFSSGYFNIFDIRAPLIVNVHEHVVVLARIEQGIVAVRQGNLLGTAFHPELTDDDRLHRFFLDIVWERKKCQI
jgi:5'-phosphate synthase pdxT subunit